MTNGRTRVLVLKDYKSLSSNRPKHFGGFAENQQISGTISIKTEYDELHKGEGSL